MARCPARTAGGEATRREPLWVKQWNELMNLPPDVEFYEDIRLIVWRLRGLLNREAVNKVITVIGELETAGSTSLKF